MSSISINNLLQRKDCDVINQLQYLAHINKFKKDIKQFILNNKTQFISDGRFAQWMNKSSLHQIFTSVVVTNKNKIYAMIFTSTKTLREIINKIHIFLIENPRSHAKILVY